MNNNKLDDLLQEKQKIEYEICELDKKLNKINQDIKNICDHEHTSISYDYDGHKNNKIILCLTCNTYI